MIKIKISELSVGANDVAIEGKVVTKDELRTVNTRFGQKNVCNFEVEDDSGKIKFSLWEKDIDTVKEGDTIAISGAYVTEWNGQNQLNIPKSGTFEVKK